MMKIEKLSCRLDNFLLNDITLNIKRDHFILLGPTGSGKTTLAKCICGFYKITEGKILLNKKDITTLPPEKRNIGYLPQDFALFPHMNVRDNILFGVKARKIDFNKVKNKFDKIVEILKIGILFKRYPNSLSGGEKQRVALARALLVDPEVLILDEPFSSIDVGLKKDIWFEMIDILKKFKIPVIHITHNLDEASILGTKIALLIDGKIIQKGNKEETLSKPKTEMAARYLGIKNIYSGIIEKVNKEKVIIKGEKFKIIAFNEREHSNKVNLVKDSCIRRNDRKGANEDMDILEETHKTNFTEGEYVKFSIRPQDIKIIKEGLPIRDELKDNIFEGKIVSAHFLSDTTILKVKSVVDFELIFPSYIYQRHNLYIGKKIRIGIWQKGISIFKKEV